MNNLIEFSDVSGSTCEKTLPFLKNIDPDKNYNSTCTSGSHACII